MTLPRTICVICATSFEARTSYGLCPSCYSKDRLREWDRLQSAIKYAQRDNLPNSLTLLQWLGTVSDFRGQCSACQIMPHSTIEMINPLAGLVWDNIVPMCRSCSQIKRTGWHNACTRIMTYLAANVNRSEDDINLEYHHESEDDEPYVPPLPEALKHSPIFRHMITKAETPHD